MANIRLKKGQVDPKNPHATSVQGATTLKGTNINNVQIESKRNVLASPETIVDFTDAASVAEYNKSRGIRNLAYDSEYPFWTEADQYVYNEDTWDDNHNDENRDIIAARVLEKAEALDEQVVSEGDSPYFVREFEAMNQIMMDGDITDWNNADFDEFSEEAVYTYADTLRQAARETQSQEMANIYRYHADDVENNFDVYLAQPYKRGNWELQNDKVDYSRYNLENGTNFGA